MIHTTCHSTGSVFFFLGGSVDSSGHIAEWRWEYTIHVHILSESILLHSKQHIFSLGHVVCVTGKLVPKILKEHSVFIFKGPVVQEDDVDLYTLADEGIMFLWKSGQFDHTTVKTWGLRYFGQSFLKKKKKSQFSHITEI